MPNRFAVAENMNMAKAWARWEATLTWRKENAVDYVLSKPHPRYRIFCGHHAVESVIFYCCCLLAYRHV